MRSLYSNRPILAPAPSAACNRHAEYAPDTPAPITATSRSMRELLRDPTASGTWAGEWAADYHRTSDCGARIAVRTDSFFADTERGSTSRPRRCRRLRAPHRGGFPGKDLGEPVAIQRL